MILEMHAALCRRLHGADRDLRETVDPAGALCDPMASA